MKKHVHFLGIGGSGMSGVALLAQAQGFEVSGCDKEVNTSYIQKLYDKNIKIENGHDANHLNEVDILAVTPAAFFSEQKPDELLAAEEKGVAITWQKFLGQYLQKDKKVISIAGTHGKSTTTAMLAKVFEEAGIDPWVMVGATVPSWEGNARIGKSDIFITESDEFFDNFLNYHPEMIILNNIEFDHPDYFASEEQMYESFLQFVQKLKGEKVLIYNDDDNGIKKLFKMLGSDKLEKFQLHPYSLKDKKITFQNDKTIFEVDGVEYQLVIPGSFNVANALGVIAAAKIHKISEETIKNSLAKFTGIGRRLEKLGEKNHITLFDDYAHHPTAIRETLKALRQKYPTNNILAIVEPHSFSRTKALLADYKNAFAGADQVIITPIFQARDKEDFGISGESIVKIADHENISYLDAFEKIVDAVKKTAKPEDVIIILGAGKSYQLAKDIYSKL